jgi:hypothetical protein
MFTLMKTPEKISESNFMKEGWGSSRQREYVFSVISESFSSLSSSSVGDEAVCRDGRGFEWRRQSARDSPVPARRKTAEDDDDEGENDRK